MAFGENGLITEAKFAKDLAANSTTAEGEGMNSLLSEYLNILSEDGGTVTPTPPEEIVLVRSISVSPSSVTLEENQTKQLIATVSPENASNKTVTWSSSNEDIASVDSSTGLVTAKTAGTATITATASDGSGVKGTCNVTVPVPNIPETTSYVGYYADVDGNGSVDGIIYADLAQPKSGQWADGNGTYSYTNPGNLKKYKVEGTDSIDGFGEKGIVKPNGGSGNERFYVMALDDVDKQQNGTRYCWYDAASGNMRDYATYTSVNFGTGEQNTSKMITRWNASGYGTQNDNSSYDDMWGISTVQSGTWNGSSGWYVPSRGEWSAFASNLNITTSNYSSHGLSDSYWSSSQSGTSYAWIAYFPNGYMSYGDGVVYSYWVRLGTTF